MGAPEPLSPRESADLLKALEGAPAPHGMARRAVAIWADEAARDAGQSAPRRALGWWAAPGFRSAFAVAATVALVLFVRGRIGVNDAPMIGDATPPPSVPLVREREKTDRSVAPPAPILQAPGGVKGSAGPTQAKPAGKRSTAKMASPSSPVVGEAERAAHAPMAEQDMLVGVPRQIVS
ncbi:MAG: hypothetical protein FJX72_19585, partial [Armatimonadetes bacterium]|nr:hypothetical protein [Armatimonadota bacterium]